MTSRSETGHAKNVANFETLIINCTDFGSTYQPVNYNITLPALSQLHQECKEAVNKVKETEAQFNDIEGRRQLAFKNLKPLSTKVINTLKSTGTVSTVIADGVTINRKIQGKRAETEPALPPGTDRISVSQQSYDMLIDHFDKLIQLVKIDLGYTPNEIPLRTESLINYKAELEAVNTAVKNRYMPYRRAMNERNRLLYSPETGLIERARMVKNYVKALYGSRHADYKTIGGLTFKVLEEW